MRGWLSAGALLATAIDEDAVPLALFLPLL